MFPPPTVVKLIPPIPGKPVKAPRIKSPPPVAIGAKLPILKLDSCAVVTSKSPGYFFIMLASDVIETDISFEEAIKTLVSCGLVTPASLKKHHH